jgi:tryptophanyl-tRNA synthetase
MAETLSVPPEENSEQSFASGVSDDAIPAGASAMDSAENVSAKLKDVSSERRKRVVSGMRPTGPLHIGHFFGALSNWLKLQEEYDCYFFVADWHALTTHYADTSLVAQNTMEVATDWLSVGVDPEKAKVFIQSSVPEHAELHLLLSMITPLGWLERVPTYKEQIENLRDKDLGTYGFLGYPLLQTADIVIYDADFVPVGEDQVPHVELSREVVRRFNFMFGLRWKSRGFEWAINDGDALRILTALPLTEASGGQGESSIKYLQAIGQVGIENFRQKLGEERFNRYFDEKLILVAPGHLLTETPRLTGTDGRRMAKSYGNAIWLKDSVEEIRAKAKNMMTDPARVRRTDPGNPDVCPVFSYHKLFSDAGTIDLVNRDCRTAAIGCVDCKRMMADGLIRWIAPVQARRRQYEANPARVWEILDAGSKTARETAQQTMARVRNAVFHWDDARRKASDPATEFASTQPLAGAELTDVTAPAAKPPETTKSKPKGTSLPAEGK